MLDFTLMKIDLQQQSHFNLINYSSPENGHNLGHRQIQVLCYPTNESNCHFVTSRASKSSIFTTGHWPTQSQYEFVPQGIFLYQSSHFISFVLLHFAVLILIKGCSRTVQMRRNSHFASLPGRCDHLQFKSVNQVSAHWGKE